MPNHHLLSFFLVIGGVSFQCSSVTTLLPVVVTTTISNAAIGVRDVAKDIDNNVLFVSSSTHTVYAAFTNGSVVLLAGSGSGSTFGARDGVGHAATFYTPSGITTDVVNGVAYIADTANTRIRRLDLSNLSVTTLAGSIPGNLDDIGTSAMFRACIGIAHDTHSSSLFVADSTNGAIRKIFIPTANVTTVTSFGVNNVCSYLCVAWGGHVLYVTVQFTSGNAGYYIMSVNTTVGSGGTTGQQRQLAGGNQVGENMVDGAGVDARFYSPQGIALNSDETLLFVVDSLNNRIRTLSLLSSSNVVGTIAGNGSSGMSDGADATFNSPCGAKWFCNASLSECGVLVTDYGNNALRFVAITKHITMTEGLTASVVASKSRSVLSSESASQTSSRPSMTSVRSESCVTSSKPLTADTTASRSLQVQMTDSFEWSRSLTISQSYLSARRSMTFGISHLSTSIAQSASLHTNSLIPSHTRLVTTSGTQTRTQSNSAVTMACSETNQTRSLSMSRFCSLTPFPGTSGVIVRVHQLKAAATLPTTDVVALGPAVPTSNGSSSSLVSSFTAPLSRQVLLRDPSPSFAFNISILLSDRMASGSMNSNESWSVVGVIRNVLSPPSTEGMFPLLLTSGDILVSTLSRVVVEQEQFLACVVSVPTSSRWLPTSLSTFTTVTMTLQVVLRCITDPAVTRNVEVVVPCPGQELILAAEVKAAASVAQYSTSLTGPAAGGAVGRLSAVRSLLTCDGSAVVAGMLPLPVTSCDKPHGSTSLVADARGFILGNFLLWASGLVLMGLAVGAYAWGTHSELRTATEALGVPSVLLPLVVVTVPSTASSTFVLLHSLRCTASDGVIAAVGGAMCVVPFVAISIVAYVAPRQLDLSASHNGSVATHSYRRTCLCVDVKLVNAIFRRRARWRSKDDQLEHRSTPTSRSHHSSSDQKKKKDTAITPWHRIGTVLLLDYAVVWYASVDIIVLTVAAVLGAVSTLQSSTTCRASAVTILVLYSGQLVLCATVRPFTTLFSFVFALLTLALAVLSVGSQVWYLLGSSADGVNLDALSRLVAAAAVCDMMVSGVSTLRMVIDGVDLLKACRRHVLAVMQHRRALTASRQPQAYVAESPPGYHPIGLELCLIDSPPLCGEHLLLQTDDVFWNIDGSAATLGGLGSVNGGGIATATQELRSTQQHVELMRFF